jgi:hypothetical protein
VPFLHDGHTPWWVREGLEALPDYLIPEPQLRPEVPPELRAAPLDAPLSELEPPCGCAHCTPPEPGVVGCLTRAPESLAVVFEAEWKQAQRHTARAWRAAAAMHTHVLHAQGPGAAEHVGADLALITGLHPRTGLNLMITSVRAAGEVPELAALVESGQLSSKHVEALLEEVCRWTDTPEQARAVLQLTLDRARQRAAVYGWPTPGQFKKRLQTAALLLDLTAAEQRKTSVHARRGVALLATGAGQAALSIEGPDLPLLLAFDAIRARAEAMGQLEGDQRTLDNRMYDAALELLQVDSDGGDSVRPSTGLDGEPLRLVVRGIEIAVLIPYSVTQGGDLELAEVPGYGPILPSTARELLQDAHSLRRVAIDATTGDVLCVDDKVPGPARTRRQATTPPTAADVDDSPDDDGPEEGRGGGGARPDPTPQTPAADGQAPEPRQLSVEQGPPSHEAPVMFGPLSDPAVRAGVPALRRGLQTLPADDPPDPAQPEHTEPTEPRVSPDTLAMLQRLAARKVIPCELDSAHYTVPGRLRRHLELRDRTCTFPGCHVPGKHCDIDHREPWPRGRTSEHNCHCLCRRHHRGKQDYFTITLDLTTGDTLWTTPDGRTYRRPPPRW